MMKKFFITLEDSARRSACGWYGTWGYIYASRPDLVDKVLIYKYKDCTNMGSFFSEETICKAILYVDDEKIKEDDFLVYKTYTEGMNWDRTLYEELVGSKPENLTEEQKIFGGDYNDYNYKGRYKGKIVKAPPMSKFDVIQDNLEEYGIII